MKKIIMLMLLCFPFNAYALNYKYQDTLVEDQKYLVKEEKLYKFYEEQKEYTTDYYLENMNPEEYPYKSDITKEITSDYLEEKPEEKLNRKVTTHYLNGYYSLKPINRIEIRNIDIEDRDLLYLTEIKITYKGEKVNSLIHCYDCKSRIEIYLEDDDYGYTGGYLYYFSILEIEFDKEYNPADLEIKLYFYNQNKKASFSVYYYDKDMTNRVLYNDKYESNEYIKFNVDLANTVDYELPKVKEYKLNLTKENIKKYKWDTTLIETKENLNEDFYQKVDNKVMYKYTDTLYKYYKINKVYLKDYLLEAPSYIKDENDYITRYLYIEKEEIESNNTSDSNTTNDNVSNSTYTSIKENNNENKEEKEEKNVVNNITNPSTFYKNRHIYLVIIIITLSLMGYMLYSLRKE